MTADVYKPYPFVFARGVKTSGLGLSGPGGILWPSYPPVSDSQLSSRAGGVPAPPALLGVSFSAEQAEPEDLVDVTFSYRISSHRLAAAGGFSSALNGVADVVYAYRNGGPRETEEPGELGNPVICLIFAFNGDTTGLPESLTYQTDQTLPLDILMTFSGALSPDTSTDNRSCVLSFNRLVCMLTLSESEGDYTISSCEWVTSMVADNDWSITVSSGYEGTSSTYTPRLDIIVSGVKAIIHPDQMGYASVYFGGLIASQAATTTLPVYADGCQSVLGPCWLPHTTFYPLVELDRTPLDTNLMDWLEMNGTDLTYSGLVSGYGIISRSESSLATEKLTSNVGQLLSYPIKTNNRGYGSFQPDYVDTRIIQDSCIYPVTGPFDHDQITAFYIEHARATSVTF